jgi:hypothetical protein
MLRQAVHAKVLADCPHRHLVFSIPKMFRIFFLFHRNLLSQLSRCAWKTICQYLEVSISEEHQPAGIVFRHGGLQREIFSTGIRTFMPWLPPEFFVPMVRL